MTINGTALNDVISHKATFIGYLGLITWALTATLTTFLYNIPVFQTLGIIFFTSFAISSLMITSSKRWNRVRQPMSSWFIGIVGMIGSELCYVASFKHTPAVQADLIHYLWPVMVIMVRGMLPGHKLCFKHMLAATLGLYGTYYLITEGMGLGNLDPEYFFGYFISFLGAVFWCFYTVGQSRSSEPNPERIGMYCGVGMVLCIVMHFAYETTVIPTLEQLAIMCLMGLTTHGLSYYFWEIGIKRGNLQMLSVLSYANPLISVIVLMLVGVAQFSDTVIISACLISLGGFVSSIPVQKIFLSSIGARFKSRLSFNTLTSAPPDQDSELSLH